MGCTTSFYYAANVRTDILNTTLNGKYTPYDIIQQRRNKAVVKARVLGQDNDYSVFIKIYSINTELEALRELEVLRKVKHHDNFVTLLDSFTDREDNTYLVISGNNTIDLFYFTNELRTIPENILRIIFYQVVQALDFMHNKNHLAHGDLSLENIVIDRENYHTYLIDFADSTGCKDNCYSVVKKRRGKVPYMSPEIYRYMLENPFKSDIWSLGICIVTCMTCRTLFEIPDVTCDQNFVKFQAHLKQQSVFRYSQVLSLLLKNMLDINPEKRFSIVQVKNHQWFDCKL